MCVVCKNQNASTTIKSGAALVSNEKLWCGMNTENVPLIRVLVPASCPIEDCQGSREGFRETFQRTFRTSSAEPDDAIMNVHVDLQEREGL